MQDALFPSTWYRVAALKPQVRSHARIQRQLYRGEPWYVLKERISGNVYRFSPAAYRVIGMMDGRRTVQQLWEGAASLPGEDAPTPEDMIGLLSQLHAAEVLACDVPPDTRELLLRGVEAGRQSGIMAALRGSPLFLRLPLADPERFLDKTFGLAAFFFTVPGLVLLLVLIGAGGLQAFLHLDELTANVVDRVLTGENIFLLFLVYPVVKGLHELGHGYAVKKWGGEVHETGVMLLVFMPIPYVDATSAASFRQRWQRMAVGGAGILVELALAAVAIFLWTWLEPGLVRATAYNVMLVGGLSTLLFNGNPLLRYDGYFIFSDLLDIPNLAQRSQAYLGYLVNRYVLGVAEAGVPHHDSGERFWFVFYGIAAFVYRLFVYSMIVYFVAGKFFFIGVLLAVWAAFGMVILPVAKKVHGLFKNPLYHARRPRAVGTAAGLLAGVLLCLFLLPLPHHARLEGVLWAPEESFVRMAADGVVQSIAAPADGLVSKGEPLLLCIDPLLEAEVAMSKSRIKEYELRHTAAYADDPIEAKLVGEELVHIREQLERNEERFQALTVKSPTAGLFVVPKADDLVGRFFQQGTLLAYVIKEGDATVRVVVPQHKVALFRDGPKKVELRLAIDRAKVRMGRVVREVPGAIDRLPSSALGVTGGGEIAVDPTDTRGSKTFERLFQFDVAVDEPLGTPFIGSRVFVRADYGFEPLAFRCYRFARRLFLWSFHV